MKKELITKTDPKSPTAEVFKTLRTNLQFMNLRKRGGLKSVLVTSTLQGEGKTWVSSNLAIAFAQMGKKVILIDADMRRGRVAPLFQVDSRPGLSNYLVDKDSNHRGKAVELESYTKETEIPNLYVMPTGDLPPNPSELLESQLVEKMIREFRDLFDIVIIDSAPTLLVTDSLILSRFADSTIIVSSYKMTKKENLKKVIGLIKNVGGNVSGIVLNKLPAKLDKYSYYGNAMGMVDHSSRKSPRI